MLKISINLTFAICIIILFSCKQVDKREKLIQNAITQIEAKNYEGALTYLNSTIAMDSNYAIAYFLRGQVFDLLGKDKDLVCKDLQKAANLGHNEAALAFNQYCNKMPQSQYDKLMLEFNTYILKNPNKFEGYYDRANLNFDYGLYDKAIEDYDRVLELNQYPVAYYNRGVCYLKLNNKDKACPDLKKALALGYEKANDALKFCN